MYVFSKVINFEFFIVKKIFLGAIIFFIFSSCSILDNNKKRSQLGILIESSSRIQVIDKSPIENKKIVLYESSDKKDILAFNKAMDITIPDLNTIYWCYSDELVKLYSDDNEIISISGISRCSLKISSFDTDVEVSDLDKWFKWFDDRNMPQFRDKYLAEKIMQEKYEKEDLRNEMHWVSGMPNSVRPVWENAIDHDFPEVNEYRRLITKAFPDNKTRALELFHWYGSGEGPWSGYPAYEGVAEELLLDVPVDDLIDSTQEDNLSNIQLEGAARFFANHYFKDLPEKLKQKLLEHSLKSNIEDNRNRAKMAFN